MKRLLIVDDEVDVREFAKRFFEKRGISVMIASGGKEALKFIEESPPDLVLLDMRMEEMTGLEVLKQCREKNFTVKVIIVSGIEDEEVMNEAKSFGVKGYIHKPLVLEELEQVVMQELNN